MKTIVLFVIFLNSFSLFAQYNSNYSFSEYIPSNSYLLKSGSNTVLIHQAYRNNEAHIWTTFDSSLGVTDQKKLVTPNANEIISQTYLEGLNTIIRIDQWIAEDQLHVSAYIFDSYGNIIYKKEISDPTVLSWNDKKLPLTPFLISQSQDKTIIALVQPHPTTENNLNISTIVFDNKLDVLNTVVHSPDFNPDLLDMYMPLVNNEGTVFLLTADKFDSYKLSSTLTCYELTSKNPNVIKREFNFSRKKIKNLNFSVSDNKLFFSAFFSQKENKSDVAGILYSGYDHEKQEYLKTREYSYSTGIKKELKKIYGPAGYKGDILNYLTILPTNFTDDINYKYAFLQSPATKQEVSREKTTDATLGDINEIRRKIAYENSFVGTQPPGFSKPMNVAEASAYARFREMGSGFSEKNNPFNNRRSEKYSHDRKLSLPKNLLFFSLKDSLQINNHMFIKIKPVADQNYNFTTYFFDEKGYSCLYYSFKTFGQPYLKKVTINHSGSVIEKIIFEDKDKIILSGYPVILNQESLIAFYEDKITNQLGLVSIKL